MPRLVDHAAKMTALACGSKGGYGTELEIEFRGVVKKVSGMVFVTHLTVDSDGNAFSSKRAHVHVIEQALRDVGFDVRTNGEVNMNEYHIGFTDKTGLCKRYEVKNAIPDDTLGLISLYLGKYVR